MELAKDPNSIFLLRDTVRFYFLKRYWHLSVNRYTKNKHITFSRPVGKNTTNLALQYVT